MSAHLSWMVIRNNNAFLVKRRNISKPFSSEPHNLTNLSSFRYSGLVHKKTLGVAAPADKRGFQLEWRTKAGRNGRRPAKSRVSRVFKGGARRTLFRLRKMIKENQYRKDLTKVALRRASAVLRSQRKIKPKKTKPALAKTE